MAEADSESLVTADSTVSSSGLEDADISFFSTNIGNDFSQKILQELNKEEYKVFDQSTPVPCGRLSLSNYASIAKHGTFKVFLFTSEDENGTYGKMKEVLESLTQVQCSNTLIVEEKKLRKKDRQVFRRKQIQVDKCQHASPEVLKAIKKFVLSKDSQSRTIPKVPIQTELLSLLDNFNKKRGYFLVLGPETKGEACMKELAKFPWLRVFDFDPFSKLSGVLKFTEPHIKSQRNLTITEHTSPDLLDLTPKSTDWIFMRGYTNMSDSYFADDPAEWCRNKENIYPWIKICKHMFSYCKCNKPPTFLVIWNSLKQEKYLSTFLLKLFHVADDENISNRLRLVTCLKNDPDHDSQLHTVLADNDCLDNVQLMSIQDVCHTLEKCSPPETKSYGCLLPRYEDTNGEKTVPITTQEMKWLEVCYNVLCIKSQTNHKAVTNTAQAPDDSGKAFLKGGEITWNQLGKYDAKRSILENAERKLLEQAITRRTSSIINIYHTPGGGGTTFAKQLLWSVHQIVPCVAISCSSFPVMALYERIQFLAGKTILPIVVLVDGKSENDVRSLFDCAHHERIIILHVQRHLNVQSPKVEPENIYLSDIVTKDECEKLHTIFCNVCLKQQRTQLDHLKQRASDGKSGHMYEYGLTSFLHEFIGLRSCVKSYLALSSETENLEGWRKVLAFLSLAHYYGQKSIPSDFFTTILNINNKDLAGLHYLEPAAAIFITENDDCTWKINHFVLAKELLEQLLTRNSLPNSAKSSSMNLSDEANSHLHELAIDFIQDVKSRVSRLDGDIMMLIQSIFFERDYKYIEDNDVARVRKDRKMFSRLLEDIPKDEDKLQVLIALVESFPEEYEFRAHLGRFYGSSYGKQFRKAEEQLEKAISMIKQQIHGHQESKWHQALSRIENMFGCIYVRKLERTLSYLGNYKPQASHQNEEFTDDLLCTAETAIHHFSENVKYETKRKCTYGYIGQLKVRLHVVEFLNKNKICVWKDISFKGADVNRYSTFVKQSLCQCDTLFMECVNLAPSTNGKQLPDFNLCLDLFNTYYNNPQTALQNWHEQSTTSRKCQITLLKLKHDAIKADFNSIDRVKSKEDLNRIIQLHEQIFRGEMETPSDIRLSTNVLEWLFAIRSDLLVKKYALATVLNVVTQWDKRNEQYSLSTFYTYVLNYVLGIITPGKKLALNYVQELEGIKKQLQTIRRTSSGPLSVRTTEWVSSSPTVGIEKIIHRSKLGEWNKIKQFWDDPRTVELLQGFTGTIIKSDNPYNGRIRVDTPHNVNITAYFPPNVYKLHGARYSQQKVRVEFFIGFSVAHGARAYVIRELKSGLCPNCSSPIVITTFIDTNCPMCKS